MAKLNYNYVKDNFRILSHYELKLNEAIHSGRWYDAATVAETISIEYLDLKERLAILGDKLTSEAGLGKSAKT